MKSTNLNEKNCRLIKNNLIVSSSNEKTYVIAVAINRDKNKNEIKNISCRSHIPIGGYVYDSLVDSYCVSCYALLHLGSVDFSFNISVESSPYWTCKVPLSDNFLKKVLSTQQKKELKNFLHKHDDSDIYYIQMTEPNL